MDLTTARAHGQEVLDDLQEVPHWSHHVAAAGLVAGAVLLLMGRKRAALTVAAAGAAATFLEHPEGAHELWGKLPAYVRNGQDFLVRLESTIEKVGEQAVKLRETIGKSL